ncbi:hypothetical protein FE783_16850 [Paenibacillus mesophilus]|uniref:hypothetical protein n=1 Tax=Paenibacillus mesophilus TaxID=2582849 RepID=UPI00110E4FD1|nr:hypothetical protein [Paenibacillus mesophilus]TMV48719.1 hypothetical protein FE783_16850 [Paenibacillus mesophilus]
MIQRRMYRAQLKEGTRDGFVRLLEDTGTRWGRELRRQGMHGGCLFEKEGGLFLYLETAGEEFEWEWPDGCHEMLEIWPGQKSGGRLAVPMLDIYHDGEAEPSKSRSGHTVRERIGSLARLKPEMYGSYVFYHHAKQEETPESFNPTYMIGAHENIIFSYQEQPAPRGEIRATRRTWPAPIAPNNWHEIMQPHFIPWSEGERGPVLWERMNILLDF